MIGPITLDGRKFICFSADSLAASQEIYIIGQLRSSGVGEVSCGPDSAKYTAEQRAEKMLTQIYISGRTHNILAGLLTEEGRAWNREDADANAVRFAGITNVDEKTAMRSSMVHFVVGVCSRDGASSETLLN